MNNNEWKDQYMVEETAELLTRSTVQKLFRGYYFDKRRVILNSTRYKDTLDTNVMIETAAKEARQTWAEEGEIPDIDPDTTDDNHTSKQNRL